MAQKNINIGTPNGKDGDLVRDAFSYTEDNFTELYARTYVAGNSIINGGAYIEHLLNFDYRITGLSYIIDNETYTVGNASPLLEGYIQGTVTLSDAHHTSSRFDVFVINKDTKAQGSISLDTGASGSVDTISVNSVQLLTGAIPFNTDLNTTAIDVANDINSNLTAPNYYARAVSGTIYIDAVEEATIPNGFVVTSTTTTITTTDSNMAGGSTDRSVGILTGFAEANFEKPIPSPATQVEVTNRITAPGETSPPEITNVLIYDENTGTPTEWDSIVVPAGTDLADTNNPSVNTVSATIPAITGTLGAYWEDSSSPLSTNPDGTIFFDLLSTASWTNNQKRFGIQLANSTEGTSSNALFFNRSSINNNFGFDHTSTTWQKNLSISIADFQYGASTFDTLRFYFDDTPSLRLDNIRFQGGITNPGGGNGVTTFIGLTDTPNNYSGEGGKRVVVKGTEDGLEFQTIPPTSALTETITVGENVAVTDIVYLNSDGKYWKTNANSKLTSTTEVRMVLATILADTSGQALIKGNSNNFVGLVVGDKYWLDESAGAITNDFSSFADTSIVRYVGTALTSVVLEFNPDKTSILKDGSDINDVLLAGSVTGPVENEYLTMATMYADQGSQTDTFIQYVADASGHPDFGAVPWYFEYLGTTVGDETDYRPLTQQEVSQIQLQADWNQTLTSSPDYIKNKPLVPVVSSVDGKHVIYTDLDLISSVNASEKLTIPTSDAQNEPVHPSVVGFDSPWNGHRYWMVMTPYTNYNDDLENPEIVVADYPEGPWTVPAGLTNPVVPKPVGVDDYNSDPEFTYNPDTNTMWMFYREYLTSTTDNRIYALSSTDGVNWTTPVLLLNSTTKWVFSPSIIYDNGVYTMWWVEGDQPGVTNRVIKKLTSTEADSGWIIGNATTVTIVESLITNHDIWHLSVNKYFDEHHLFLTTSETGTSGESATLVFGRSLDGGDTFNIKNNILTPTGQYQDWDAWGIYRGTAVYLKDRSKYGYWYSAVSGTTVGDGAWGIGYTEIDLNSSVETIDESTRLEGQTAIDLTKEGNYYNLITPLNNTTYTINSAVLDGTSVIKINAPTEPILEGADKIVGESDVFEANTDMYIKAEFKGLNVEYTLTKLNISIFSIPDIDTAVFKKQIINVKDLIGTNTFNSFQFSPDNKYAYLTSGAVVYQFKVTEGNTISIEYEGNHLTTGVTPIGWLTFNEDAEYFSVGYAFNGTGETYRNTTPEDNDLSNYSLLESFTPGRTFHDLKLMNNGTEVHYIDRLAAEDGKVKVASLGTPYLISTIGVASEVDISAQTGDAKSLSYSNDGTKMYITELATGAGIFQYSLGTAFDPLTRTYDSVEWGIGGRQSTGVAFMKGTQRRVFVSETNFETVREYHLYDLTTPIQPTIPQSLDRLLENSAVTGTFDIDYDSFETWYLTLTGATTFTESNLPTSGTNTKVITIHVTGDQALTFPSGWDVLLEGAYDGSEEPFASGTVTCAGVLAGDTVTVNGLLYTAVAGVKADNTEFSVDTGNTECATDLAASITADVRAGTLNDVTATSSLGLVTMVQTVKGIGGNATTLVSSNGTRLAVSGATFTGGDYALHNTIVVEYIKTGVYKVEITKPD